MTSRRNPVEGDPELDRELSARFAAYRSADVAPPLGLDVRSLDHVEASLTVGDLVEFGTALLVIEFLGPVLDLFAFALGFEDGEDSRG